MNKRKWLQKMLEQQRWEEFKRFRSGFKFSYLVKIVDYYSLPCADRSQQRCIYKSIRQAKLNYQQIWEAITND